MSVKRVHRNSVEAYHKGRTEEFTRRESQILSALERLIKATDRQIAEFLGFVDMNAVRPRISELIEQGLIRESGECVDAVTRKRVRVVEISPLNSVQAQQLNMWGEA